VTGGGLPARIWRDFMARAYGERGRPVRRADPRDEVGPQDILPSGTIPLGDAARLRIEDGKAVISADVAGVPIDVGFGGDTVTINGNRVLKAANPPDAPQRAP